MERFAILRPHLEGGTPLPEAAAAAGIPADGGAVVGSVPGSYRGRPRVLDHRAAVLPNGVARTAPVPSRPDLHESMRASRGGVRNQDRMQAAEGVAHGRREGWSQPPNRGRDVAASRGQGRDRYEGSPGELP